MIEIRMLAKVFVVRDNQLLVIRRSQSDDRRPWQWDIPGGHTNATEYIEEAAVRETFEEAGIRLDSRQLRLVATHSQKVSETIIVHWLFYTAIVTASDVVNISDEHDDFRWVGFSEALSLITYDIQHNALAFALDNKLFDH